jgi:hypothetical protein
MPRKSAGFFVRCASKNDRYTKNPSDGQVGVTLSLSLMHFMVFLCCSCVIL